MANGLGKEREEAGQRGSPDFRPGIGGMVGRAESNSSPTGQLGTAIFRPGIGGIDYRSRFEGNSDRPGKSPTDNENVSDRQTDGMIITVSNHGLESEPMPGHNEGLGRVRTSGNEPCTSQSEPRCSSSETIHTKCSLGCIETDNESVCEESTYTDSETSHRETTHKSANRELGNVVSMEEEKRSSPGMGNGNFDTTGLEEGVKVVAMVPLRNKKQMQVTYIASRGEAITPALYNNCSCICVGCTARAAACAVSKIVHMDASVKYKVAFNL